MGLTAIAGLVGKTIISMLMSLATETFFKEVLIMIVKMARDSKRTGPAFDQMADLMINEWEKK